MHKSDKIRRLLREILHELKHIVHLLHPSPVTHFRIIQENAMEIIGIIPGDTGTFKATPLNKAGVTVALLPSVIPVWTSSDPVNAPVLSGSADGLTAFVSVPATFTPAVGQVFTLTVAMPDGSASTAVEVPFEPVAVDNVVASFGIEQVS